MSTPISTVFQGDLTVEQGTDIPTFGYGDVTVARNVIVKGTGNSFGSTTGALVVHGGLGVAMTANLHEHLNVLYGVTSLTETHVDTTNGRFTASGGNSIDFSVGATSRFISTAGNMSVGSETQRLFLYGGNNTPDAVNIQANHSDGGISILAGSGNGNISLTSGAGGIYGTTSNGNIVLTSNNANASLVVNSQNAGQNLVVGLVGATDSQVRVESEGNNTTIPALVVRTVNTAGNIVISNADGLGNGSMAQLVGSGGFRLLTNTGGSIDTTSQGAPTSISVNSAAPGHNLTLSLNNPTNSTLAIESAGTDTAVSIRTTNTSGNIVIQQPPLSSGHVNIFTGSNGFATTTQTGGSIIMTAYGASSVYTNATTADGQHLYVSVTGNTDSRVIIDSDGPSNQAVTIQATNNSGGVLITANSTVQLESKDTNNGISIATLTPGIPVKIGSSNSTTTVYGNLDVKGVTTTIQSTVLTVDDNIIVVNNAPSGTSDGGLAVKRYQSANDVSSGDVVQDTPEETGTIGASGNSSTSLQLSSSASSVDNYYNGWWVKITGGTGENQVRRIKSYNGSTRVATIYGTLDQDGTVPNEALDFGTIPDLTSSYNLYPCHYVMNIWDESSDQFAYVCSSTNPAEQVSISHYADLRVGNLISNSLTTSFLNGAAADISITVTLNDGNTIPVPILGLPNNYGVYQVFVKPKFNTTRTHAIFVIGRVNVPNLSGTTNRIMSIKGAQNEQLYIQWLSDDVPHLVYRPNPLGGSGSTVYQLKIVSL